MRFVTLRMYFRNFIHTSLLIQVSKVISLGNTQTNRHTRTLQQHFHLDSPISTKFQISDKNAVINFQTSEDAHHPLKGINVFTDTLDAFIYHQIGCIRFTFMNDSKLFVQLCIRFFVRISKCFFAKRFIFLQHIFSIE